MSRPRVVIVGAGFGGLSAARALRKADADVLVVDRHNYHLFQPLLYQVASSSTSAASRCRCSRRSPFSRASTPPATSSP
jgi:NADH dehydrogenase